MKVVVLFSVLVCHAYGSLLGGWSDVSVTDESALATANACVQELNAKSNSLYKYKLVNLKKAQVQAVAGWKYKFVFDMGKTSCQNNGEMIDLEACQLTGTEYQTCTVVVWVQPWLKNQQILENNCQPSKPQKMPESTNLKWTGMEQGLVDSLPQQTKDNIDQKQKKLLLGGNNHVLGGDDHDVGNYGEFENFKVKYNKKYKDSNEEVERFKIFRTNMKRVQELQDNERGSAKYGATEFADMSESEFRRTHLTPKWNLKQDPLAKKAEIPNVTPPRNFDWRDHGAVTAVKNQGSCGSCWAFSTTGNVEGQWAIKKKQLISLSEQELVDCDKVDQGCNGGLPVDAYKAIMKLGGLETEKEYPYKGDDDKCSFVKSDAKVDINGYLNISSNETEMAAWLYKNGPISIGINAMAMQFYMGGVSHPFSVLCNPKSLDHGVLIVGYGVKKTGIIFKKDTPFWIIKNSWGAGWGENGYYLLYRGAGVCGVNQMPTSAVVN